MRTFMVVVIVSLFGFVLSAETAKTPAPATGTAPAAVSTAVPAVKAADKTVMKDKDCVTEERYCCEKHEKIESLAPGKCPICKQDLIKQTKSFTFKCPVCGYSTSKAGNCPIDKGVKLKKFRVIYTCVPDNITSGLPGFCPKCGEPFKKVVDIPVK